MNKQKRQQDILAIIEKLDISTTMHQNAVSKYESITKHLESNGIEADMYPQGSFALGTVIRPITKDPNAAYDLDFICQIRKCRDQQTAEELHNEVENILKQSNLYGGKLKTYEKCITIEYADIGDIGFSIDIVPAAGETDEIKKHLSTKSESPQLIDTAIAIPKACNSGFDWAFNNPKGYRTWFEEINLPFKETVAAHQRQILFEANRSIFASVEDIPHEMIRSSIQRVIQLLKYHRNVYYSSFNDGDATKPISAIISTLVASVAATQHKTISVFELLNCVLNEFVTYSQYQNLTEKLFFQKFPSKNLIYKENGKWFMKNPAHPEDNLADQWNQDSDIPQRFFRWIAAAKEDLLDSLELCDEDFRAKIETAFDPDIVSTNWGNKYRCSNPTPIYSSKVAKPWKRI